MESKILPIPPPEEMSPEQSIYWLSQVEYWTLQGVYATYALDYSRSQLEEAKRMLGIQSTE